jgi:hypothetical protein
MGDRSKQKTLGKENHSIFVPIHLIPKAISFIASIHFMEFGEI